jgi:hypothetical protein
MSDVFDYSNYDIPYHRIQNFVRMIKDDLLDKKKHFGGISQL